MEKITTSPSSAKAFSKGSHRWSSRRQGRRLQGVLQHYGLQRDRHEEIWELFEYLEQFGVDGHSISPGYGYSAVNDREMFLTREDVYEKFKGHR
jgi:hypothetical protein